MIHPDFSFQIVINHLYCYVPQPYHLIDLYYLGVDRHGQLQYQPGLG